MVVLQLSHDLQVVMVVLQLSHDPQVVMVVLQFSGCDGSVKVISGCAGCGGGVTVVSEIKCLLLQVLGRQCHCIRLNGANLLAIAGFVLSQGLVAMNVNSASCRWPF